jgi:conjugal transfer pilus assembly protein TraV
MNKHLILLLSLLLTGCSSMNSTFECKTNPTGVCASLSEVNERVNRGEIGRTSSQLKNSGKNTKSIDTPAIGLTPYPNTPASVSYPFKPQRQGDTVMRIWVAPYEDNDGYYHEASEVFAVTTPGRWIKPTVKESS